MEVVDGEGSRITLSAIDVYALQVVGRLAEEVGQTTGHSSVSRMVAEALTELEETIAEWEYCSLKRTSSNASRRSRQ